MSKRISSDSPRALRTIRVVSQVIFFALFLFLFRASASVIRPLFVNPFFEADPLLFIGTSPANRALQPWLLPLLFLLASVVLGRVFCGFVCPLGSLIDGFDSLAGKIRASKRNYRSAKYYILLFLLTTSVLGASSVYFFDPMVILGRSFTAVFMPVASFFTGRPVLHNGFLFLITLAVILGLGFVQKRFWCGNLCPLGGLLGILSRLSILKYSIKEDCNECNLCAQLCPTRAIDVETKSVSQYECVRCMNCLGDCTQRKIELKIGLPSRQMEPVDMSRRGLIASIGLGIIAAPLLKTESFRKINPAKVIRPPGSIPEHLFVDACVRCGECIKVCPTNGLQPIVLERGLGGLFTPRLVARIGGCERNCNGCGQVCPTGAIRKLSLDEKSYVKMGTAVIHKEMCLAWEQDKVCLICDEACPYNAIDSRLADLTGNRLLRPFINEELCTGCGICESRCPITGPSAIEVLPIGEERMSEGLYITARKRQLRKALEQGANEDIPSGFTE